MRASWRTGRVKAMRVAGFAGLLDRGGLQRGDAGLGQAGQQVHAQIGEGEAGGGGQHQEAAHDGGGGGLGGNKARRWLGWLGC